MSAKLLIVDRHEIIRLGVAAALRDTDIEVVGDAGSLAEAARKIRKLQPDVVLLDASITGIGGTSVVPRLRKKFPALPIVVHSSVNNPSLIAVSSIDGAADYVLKDAPLSLLTQSIQRAAYGHNPPEESLLLQVEAIMAKWGDRLEIDGVRLSRRELQVLRHLGLGLSNRQISEFLDIREVTVADYVKKLLRKLHMNDRTTAAVWAVREKLV